MDTRAIIRTLLIVGVFVIGWTGLALAGEVCDKFPTAPGARVITAGSADQLAEAVGDPENLNAGDNPAFPTAQPGDFICITQNLTIVGGTGAGTDNVGTAVNITIPNITIYGAIVNSTTGARATLAAGTGLTAAIFEVGATGAQMALMPAAYLAPPYNATGNPSSVAITDPIFDCAGNANTAITVLPGANYTVIELNTIGGLTGACATAGVLVRADRDTNNDQARDDTDGDGLLEDTVGTRIRANIFAALQGASGPAILIEENVLGNPDPNAGVLEDQPPFEQCTTAGTNTVHTVIGSTSANATINNDNVPTNGIADYADVGRGGALTHPGPWSRNDGNQIYGTAGSWAGGIYSEGSHICIRGNLIGSSVTITVGPGTVIGTNTAAAGTIAGDGIRVLPGGNGHAIWGNVIGGINTTPPGTPTSVAGDGIAVLGPFKLGSVSPDGDSVYDNIVGNDNGVYGLGTVSISGPGDDGVLCADERIYVQGSSQGAQRVVGAGDDGFDMSNLDGDGEGGFCTKRDAVFNNDAINNGGNGFEGGTDYVDNDAHRNVGDGFFVPGTATFPNNRFCGNVASQNGDDGFDVDDNNLFTNAAGPYGSATCARGGNRALANGDDGFELGGGNVFEPATVPGTPTIGGSPVHFAWCNADNGVEMGTGGGDANRIRRVSAMNNEDDGFTTLGGSDGNHLSNNVAGNIVGTGAGGALTTGNCTPAGHPASAPALTALPGGLAAGDQDNGWNNVGGTVANPNRAWRNTFGDPDFENATTLGPAFTGNAANGVRIVGGSVVLEESSGAVTGAGSPTAPADLDGNGVSGEACNVITNNLIGLYVAAGPGGNHQIDDFDGQGGTRLSNIYEQRATTPDQVDIEHDGTGTLKAEGLWTLLTVGPTPDIDVGPSNGTVQVSSTRVHTLTTVSALLTACAGDPGTTPPTPPNPAPVAGDVDLDGDFDQDDVDALLNALRNRAAWLSDPTSQQFQNADVARPCGRITNADRNRLRSSLLRVQRGRTPLASQCGTNPIIGQPTSALGLVLNVLSGHAGAASVQATVYSLTGRRLLEQKASGTQIALELAKPKLANGVYLVVITSLGPDGRVLAREVRKVVILR